MAGGKGIGGLGWSGVYLGWMFGYLIVCTRMQLVRKARGLPRFAPVRTAPAGMTCVCCRLHMTIVTTPQSKSTSRVSSI